jgi:23S rRNA pseudouridine2605 synthase
VEDKEKKAKAKPATKSANAKKAGSPSTSSEAAKTTKAKATPAPKAKKAAEVPAAEKKVAAKKAVASATVAPEKKSTAKKAPAATEVAAKKKPTAKKATASAEGVADKKPAAKAKKAAAPVETPEKKKPTAKKATVAAEIATAKPTAKAKKATAAPAPEKKTSTKKATASAVAPAPEKKTSAKKVTTSAEATEKKPSAKAKKSAVAAAPEKKSAAKKVAASAEVATEKKPSAKAKKSAAASAAAPSEAAATEESKKVRTKPRRRELKRQGLWVPKHQRGKHGKQQAALADERKPLFGKRKEKPAPDAPKPADKGKPAEDLRLPKGKAEAAPSNKKADHKEKWDQEGKAPKAKSAKSGDAKPTKVVPDEFGEFAPRLTPKAERKQDRRQERTEKAEREYNQSQGLFEEPIRLNRFVALSGICSRRDADGLIQAGKVKVNGKIVREMGHKVQPGKDKVVYKDHELRIKVFVYLLMNKPKNRISTTDDELGRDTVMEIAERYTKARVYPVGRLDRNTTGLLLLTNDGDLTMKLTHPSSKFPKLYNVRVDHDITDADIQALRKGFELEDGFIKADQVSRTRNDVQNEIGIQIHSGANHIVKRMMAHLGYEVIALDRVQIGPLTKRGLARGTCRLLSDKEVGFLKML